jgi:ribosome-binding protein aMBF1 (putative translation factor)
MAKLNTILIDNKKFVLVPFAEYKLLEKGVPPLPPADAHGNRPARATVEAEIARGIVRDREAVGLTQTELAAAAGIRVEVLNRIERGVNLPSMRTAAKIDNALMRAGLKRKPLAD